MDATNVKNEGSDIRSPVMLRSIDC